MKPTALTISGCSWHQWIPADLTHTYKNEVQDMCPQSSAPGPKPILNTHI